MITKDTIAAAGLSQNKVIRELNKDESTAISQPSFYKRMEDQNWLHSQVLVFMRLGIWDTSLQETS